MPHNTSLADRLDRDFAEAWKPSAGATLIGEVVEISQRAGEFGAYPIVTVRQDDGTERAFHAFHAVAANELAKVRPQIGTRIAVRYAGQRATGDGKRTFHAYRVVVDRPAAAFDWTEFADPAAAAEAAGVAASDVTPPTDDDIPF